MSLCPDTTAARPAVAQPQMQPEERTGSLLADVLEVIGRLCDIQSTSHGLHCHAHQQPAPAPGYCAAVVPVAEHLFTGTPALPGAPADPGAVAAAVTLTVEEVALIDQAIDDSPTEYRIEKRVQRAVETILTCRLTGRLTNN